VPLYFIGGEHDLTNVMDPNGINRMAGMFPGFQGSTVIPNIGHWTQQEDSVSFNAALENFLGTLS
jgi:pimeloyl-ACP methyl ester carboxylesterase